MTFLKKVSVWMLLVIGLQKGFVEAEGNISIEDNTFGRDVISDMNTKPFWSTFQYNFLRNGRTSFQGILTTPNVQWTYYSDGYIFAPAVIDCNERIYLVTTTGNLHILSPQGKKEKIINLESSINSSPTLDKEGNAYIGTDDGVLFCVNPEGEIKWRFETKNSISKCAPALGPNGDIYVGTQDGYLWAVSQNGQPKWRYPTKSAILSSPAVNQSGIIYITTSDGYIWAIKPDGSLVFRKNIQASLFSSPAIDNQGNIYVGAIAGGIIIVKPDNTIDNIFLTADVFSSPALGPQGEIYIGTNKGLYGLNKKNEWYAKTGAIFGSSPIVDKIGNIYIASRNGQLYCVTPQGEIKWSVGIGFIPTSLAIGENGTIYAGSRDKNLYAISNLVLAPPDSLKKKAKPKPKVQPKLQMQQSAQPVQPLPEIIPPQKPAQPIQPLPEIIPPQKPAQPVQPLQPIKEIIPPQKPAQPIQPLPEIIPPQKPAQPVQPLPEIIPPQPPVEPKSQMKQQPQVVAHPPCAPTNLKLKSVSASDVTLIWQDISKGEAYFKVERMDKNIDERYLTVATLPKGTTIYQDEGLRSGTEYLYRIKAYNMVGESNALEILIKTKEITPFLPTKLNAKTLSSNKIILNWQDNSQNEQGFKIERMFAGESYKNIATTAPNITTYTDINLNPSTAYIYRISSYNEAGKSIYSNEAMATTLDIPPFPPSELKAVSILSDQIRLIWQDNANNEDEIILERMIDNKGYEERKHLPANAISYLDTDLLPNTSYSYRLRAYNQTGYSAYTQKIVIKTKDVLSLAPANLRCKAVTSNQVNIIWQDCSNNETGFKIERKQQGGISGREEGYREIAIVAADVTTYYDTNVTPESDYIYRICSYNNLGKSDYTQEIAIKTPAALPQAPSSLEVKQVLRDRVLIKWQDTSDNENGFKIERALTGDEKYREIAILPHNITSYEDKNLMPDRVYCYRITAYNDVGTSTYSNMISIKTLSGAKPVSSPMSGFNSQRTGLSPYQGPRSPGVKWSYIAKGPIYSSPVVGQNGVVYFGSGDCNVYALAPNGSLKWKFATGGEIRDAIAIGANEEIYVGSYDGNFYCLDSRGKLRWSYSTGSPIHSSPVIDSSGTIYFTSNNGFIYALLPDGKLKWSKDLKGVNPTSAAISPQGIIYVAASNENGGLYAFDSNGELKWKYNIESEIQCSPVVDPTGPIYLGFSDIRGHHLYCFYPDGEVMWDYVTANWIKASPAVDSSGIIYLPLCYRRTNDVSVKGSIVAINHSGNFLWSYDTGWVTSSPIIDSEGKIYISSNDGNIYSLYSDGSLDWIYSMGVTINNSPVISENEILYVGANNGVLYSLGKGAMPPETPSNLTANIKYNNRIVLNWKDNSSNELGFKLERREMVKNKPFAVIANLPLNTTNYEDFNALPNTTYSYVVRAYNFTGLSSSSNPVEVKTYPIPISAPTCIKITNSKENRGVAADEGLVLTWENPRDENFSHVRIYRSLLREELGSLIADEIRINRYEDNDVVSGLTYYYTIKSVDKRGWESLDTTKYPARAIDITSPEIIEYSPRGKDVSPDTKIIVSFSEEMNKGAVEKAFFLSTSLGGQKIKGKFNWKDNQLIFTPDRLESQTSYLVKIFSIAEDITGNNLKDGITWQFETANLPPIIWSYRPISRNPSMKIGDCLLFAISAYDPEDKEVSCQWFLDGVLKSTENSWTYAPLAEDKGTKTMLLKVSDRQKTTNQSWTIIICE